VSATRNAFPTVRVKSNANATSIRGLAFACAGSVVAFAAFLVGVVVDLGSGPHFSLFHIFGIVLFGSLSADWLDRLVRIARLRRWYQ
jgi:hypothetical protein